MSTHSATAARLAALVRTHEAAVLAGWVASAATGLGGRMTRPELERELTALVESILEGLSAGSVDAGDDAYASVRHLLVEMSDTRARQGFSPRETCVAVFAFKDGVAGVLDQAPEIGAADVAVLNRLVDDLGLLTFETFAAAREQIIVDQADQLLELSTPVVKLWEGVLAVPLIGTLDSARTQVVMEKLLQALVDTGSEHAIIDITGVPAVDTQVAQHLLKTVAAARLMGADCLISGIRPQIAQTIVGLGIEFGDIRTKATLADALVAALHASGVTLSRARASREV